MDGSRLADRLRARRAEIEGTIFVRVRSAVADQVGDGDVEYVEGLRAAVAAALELGLAGIERGVALSVDIPAAASAQARRAAGRGVSLDAVLRRYIVGHAVLCDYIMEEAAALERSGQSSGLREVLGSQASLLDQLVIGVTREHVVELQRTGYSRERRLLERVRALIAGQPMVEGIGESVDSLSAELGYDLDAEHVGVVGRGPEVEQFLRAAAQSLNRRVLCFACGEDTVWAWFAGERRVRIPELVSVLSGPAPSGTVCVAVGEPGLGLDGWRLTHRQAQAAQLVAIRRPQPLTRYADVALVAAALQDETLARSLIEVFLSPLGDSRDGGAVLRETLRAYVAAEYNVSSAAAGLKVVRTTVVNRLRTIEERLGQRLRPCSPELEVALSLDQLGVTIFHGSGSAGRATYR